LVTTEEEKAFYWLILYSEPDGGELWTVGIRSEDHGVLPEAVAVPESRTRLIGANCEVHFLSWADKALIKCVQLGFLFRSFIFEKERSLVLVVHETGLIALSNDGSEKWRLVRDVVQTVQIAGNHKAPRPSR
jgi:hypothetical protein